MHKCYFLYAAEVDKYPNSLNTHTTNMSCCIIDLCFNFLLPVLLSNHLKPSVLFQLRAFDDEMDMPKVVSLFLLFVPLFFPRAVVCLVCVTLVAVL